jgi:(E)-4-hydroxy-3-methylbut-2-enyl-diphosphate synthase
MKQEAQHNSFRTEKENNILFNYKRRRSEEIQIGNLTMGGHNPVRIQSMANTDTNDTESSVEQCIRVVDAGGELVRFTAQGVREAANLKNIRKKLSERGYNVPLVADIHFNPKAAETAALHVEKVRINPGNFVDSVHTTDRFEYTDEEYQEELEKIKTKLLPFLQICREHKTAVRIGVNHGSLSNRILSRYGDTSKGMVESCMEFLRICKEDKFNHIVISIKASNTVVMVQTVRLLVAAMQEEGMAYPLHLGVTEAGDGEDGRIKSAVGIGALLADGIGDTIRVSLSEEPECEIPVARKLVEYISSREGHPFILAEDSGKVSPFIYNRRKTCAVGIIGGSHQPVVIASSPKMSGDLRPDFVYAGKNMELIHVAEMENLPVLVDYTAWQAKKNMYPLFTPAEANRIRSVNSEIKFLELSYPDCTDELLSQLDDSVVLIIKTDHINGVGEQRAFLHKLLSLEQKNPVILKRTYCESQMEDLQIMAGADLGVFFIDGLGDGIWIEDEAVAPDKLLSVSFGVLQASRVRVSKTEFISCPGCGRTLFDLQKTIARVKEKTSHLKGLKIGIMGCIVNGPGEMADADYGYVGSGKGKVNLYKGQTCIEKLIPEEQAVERLIRLIKDNGDWKENSF